MTTHSSTISGALSCARSLPCENAPTTTSTSSQACATINSARRLPKATEKKRNVRVARAYCSNRGSSALTARHDRWPNLDRPVIRSTVSSRSMLVQRALHHLVLGIAKTRADPVDQHLQAPAANAAEVVHVHGQIGEERQPPRDFVAADFTHGLAAADDRQRALVQVVKRRRSARRPLVDRLRRVARLLDRDRRQSREGLAVGPFEQRGVADHRDLGMAGNRQVGFDLHAPRPVGGGPSRLGEHAREADGLHAGGPDHRPRVDPLVRAVDRGGHALRVDRGDARTLANRDPKRGKLLGDLARKPLAEGGGHAFAGVEQDHLRVAGIDFPESRASSRAGR